MDLPKLAALLTSSSLWFSRADLLGDPHEGVYGRFNHENRKLVYRDLDDASFAALSEGLSNSVRIAIQNTHVSCWHMNDEESVAMWRAYAGSGQAVAVRSTYRRLRDAIVDERPVYIGQVKYVDTGSDWIPEDNALQPIVHKRRSFEYERELRAVFRAWGPEERGYEGRPSVDGVSIKVELPGLVEAVYVGPQQPAWFREVVERVTDALAPDVEVRQSDLDSDVLY